MDAQSVLPRSYRQEIKERFSRLCPIGFDSTFNEEYEQLSSFLDTEPTLYSFQIWAENKRIEWENMVMECNETIQPTYKHFYVHMVEIYDHLVVLPEELEGNHGS